ncbi:hypothetical protein Q7C36_008358 [Tachysurus vachellii]|uniref:Uncharacterized protein n=1 Tax=Tachysurus vachellii TaxID=175792 RepID=A0AA88T3Y9_TACVA|nr:hypothetical protein Q7C36_008358 [Tachysurus vachellii]
MLHFHPVKIGDKSHEIKTPQRGDLERDLEFVLTFRWKSFMRNDPKDWGVLPCSVPEFCSVLFQCSTLQVFGDNEEMRNCENQENHQILVNVKPQTRACVIASSAFIFDAETSRTQRGRSRRRKR